MAAAKDPAADPRQERGEATSDIGDSKQEGEKREGGRLSHILGRGHTRNGGSVLSSTPKWPVPSSFEDSYKLTHLGEKNPKYR